MLAGTDDPLFEVINLGESRTVTLSTMIEILADDMGVTPQIETQPMQPGDVRQTFADISKARRVLGYDPRWGFREGLRQFLDWFENAPGPT